MTLRLLVGILATALCLLQVQAAECTSNDQQKFVKLFKGGPCGTLLGNMCRSSSCNSYIRGVMSQVPDCTIKGSNFRGAVQSIVNCNHGSTSCTIGEMKYQLAIDNAAASACFGGITVPDTCTGNVVRCEFTFYFDYCTSSRCASTMLGAIGKFPSCNLEGGVSISAMATTVLGACPYSYGGGSAPSTYTPITYTPPTFTPITSGPTTTVTRTTETPTTYDPTMWTPKNSSSLGSKPNGGDEDTSIEPIVTQPLTTRPVSTPISTTTRVVMSDASTLKMTLAALVAAMCVIVA